MAHEHQERYSELTLVKMRAELALKDGVVFNNDYEGDPKALAVKVPVRDKEVEVSDYNKSTGMNPTEGATSYKTIVISKDKGVNEIIDGYDEQSVPDNLVADRLDSAGYSLASVVDTDGGSTLLSGGTIENVESITTANIYDIIVEIRKNMSKANVPNDGSRYMLVTPDIFAILLKSPQFVSASSLGDEVKQSGIIGRIAGFNIIEWNDSTANLAMIAGHPRFATRIKDWSVPVHIQSLDESGKYIGAVAVQGRMVYDHAVLRASAIRCVFSPAVLSGSLAAATGSGTSGKTVVTISSGNTGTTYAYKINPVERAKYGVSSANYGGTALTSGTTAISVSAGDVIEVVNFDSSAAVAAGYFTVSADDIAE